MHVTSAVLNESAYVRLLGSNAVNAVQCNLDHTADAVPIARLASIVKRSKIDMSVATYSSTLATRPTKETL